MSIYSGFATRSQQQCYDQCIDSLLYILQRRIIKFYKNEEADQEKFITLVLKIHHQLKTMENNKYLQPKSSIAVNELIKLMSLHQKNMVGYKNKTSQRQPERLPTHQPLPIVEQKQTADETLPKKKDSLWVERKIPKIQHKMIDQQIQTMGTIYEKKDPASPKQSTITKIPIQRQAISALRTKYGQKISTGKKYKGQQYSQNIIQQLRNRSQSHHLPKHQAVIRQNYQVKNHLKEVEIREKRKRKQKLNSRLGLKDLNTEEDSQYGIGDIIKQFLIRGKRKSNRHDYQTLGKEGQQTINDF